MVLGLNCAECGIYVYEQAVGSLKWFLWFQQIILLTVNQEFVAEMAKIVYKILVIAYLCVWTEGTLSMYKCYTAQDIIWQNENYGNCDFYSALYGKQCTGKLITAETTSCSGINQNDFDDVFEYSLEKSKSSTYHKNFKRTVIIKYSSIPTLRALQTKNIGINQFQLSNLGISQIVPGFFSGIFNLTSLSLDNNELTEITDGTFSPLNKVEDLDLSNNRLQEVKEHTFAGLISLTRLNLNKNNISKINPNAFLYSNKLIRVDLSDNDISMINLSCSIQELNVSYNSISTISNLNQNLRVLDVSYNKISNISTIFTDTQQLRTLNISHNILLDLPLDVFKSLKNLTYLDLSYNQLTKIEVGVLNGLSNLQYLNIEANRLSTLALYAFPLDNLATFYFGKNFINDFDIDEFQAPLLTSISFDGPGWQCAKLAKIVHKIKSRNITIKMESSFKSQNIDGIMCMDENKETKHENAADIDSKFEKEFTSGNSITYVILILSILQLGTLVFIAYGFITFKKNLELKRNYEQRVQLI